MRRVVSEMHCKGDFVRALLAATVWLGLTSAACGQRHAAWRGRNGRLCSPALQQRVAQQLGKVLIQTHPSDTVALPLSFLHLSPLTARLEAPTNHEAHCHSPVFFLHSVFAAGFGTNGHIRKQQSGRNFDGSRRQRRRGSKPRQLGQLRLRWYEHQMLADGDLHRRRWGGTISMVLAYKGNG